MMKKTVFFTMSTLLAFGGFFNETESANRVEYVENERLCTLFTKKVEDYKKTMRADFFAKTTLASYEHRASLFCKKAEDIKSELNITDTKETNSSDTNTTY